MYSSFLAPTLRVKTPLFSFKGVPIMSPPFSAADYPQGYLEARESFCKLVKRVEGAKKENV